MSALERVTDTHAWSRGDTRGDERKAIAPPPEGRGGGRQEVGARAYRVLALVGSRGGALFICGGTACGGSGECSVCVCRSVLLSK